MWSTAHPIRLVIVVAMLLVAGIWVHAQRQGAGGLLDLRGPDILAGNDLGFRVESTKGGIAVGRLVVRIDGRWMDAQVGIGGVIQSDVK
jgi:hypothetical protein